MEVEISGEDRFAICGIKYEPIPDTQFRVSKAIDEIVARIDEFSRLEYLGYKDESESLFDEVDESLIYRINLSNGSVLLFDSGETVFTDKNELVKIYQVKIGERIRVYPKHEFAENLYNVAVEMEPDVFGKIEEHSAFWRNLMTQLDRKFGREGLYQRLRGNGLRVLPATVDGYLKGERKFPMFNNDLRAIMKLHYDNKVDFEINELLGPMLRSKTIYNSTMISLGRGLKQELRLFLNSGIMGEILTKRKFIADTLNKFITDFMPLLTVAGKQIYDNSDISSGIEKVEL
jgi:hypothetical protein